MRRTGLLSRGAQDSHRSDLSGNTGSRHKVIVVPGLSRPMACGRVGSRGAGIEPVPLHWKRGAIASGPLGKSLYVCF